MTNEHPKPAGVPPMQSGTATRPGDADGPRFIDHHLPALPAGRFVVTVEQTVGQTSSGGTNRELQRFTAERVFEMRGARYCLSPQDVTAVYPPPGSTGDYDAVMPHVILARSTLPWERSPGKVKVEDERIPPWLAVILVGEQDDVRCAMTTLGELSNDEAADFPRRGERDPTREPNEVEIGESDGDPVQVVDLLVDDLPRLLPKAEHLHLLAHVCLSKAGSDAQESVRATVVSHRTAVAPGRITAHLISIEGRYDGQDFVRCEESKKRVRFVSLKQWSFVCTQGTGQRFETLAKALDVGTLRLPAGTVSNADADYFLALGAVPLPHQRRSDPATISFYHGPLAPWTEAQAPAGENGDMPRCAQDLVLRHDSLAIDDLGYAAAWELGRLTMLQDRETARQLYQWKCRCFQQACCAELADSDRRHATDHLACHTGSNSFAFPTAWFDRLARLEGIPFCYLVADERMLPRESLRIFEADRRWIEALLDGAFSVGSLTGSECDVHGAAMRRTLHARIPTLSGFLLRSSLVSSWPDLHVAVEREDRPGDAPRNPEDISRRLSADTLLLLFTGQALAIELSVPRALSHFEWTGTSFPAEHKRSGELAASRLAKQQQRLQVRVDRS